MKFSEFTGEAQHRMELGTQAEAVRAVRSTLTTVSERLYHGEASDLAGALPMEVDYYVKQAESDQRFDFDEFVNRVAARENADKPDALRHAQIVMDITAQTIPQGELDDLKSNLPDDYEPLFELVEQEE